MKNRKIIGLLVLGLGVVGSSMQGLPSKDVMETVKTYATIVTDQSIAKTAFNAMAGAIPGGKVTGADIINFLLLGIEVTALASAFDENVTAVKSTLGNLTTQLQKDLGDRALSAEDIAAGKEKLQDLLAKLKKPETTAAEKEALVPKVNERIINLFDLFYQFINAGGANIFVPVMSALEKVPGLGDKMKFGSGATLSKYTGDSLASFGTALDIEKKLVPKISTILNQKAEITKAQAAGTPPPAPAAPVAFDDL